MSIAALRRWTCALATVTGLAGCVSLGAGGDAPPLVQLGLADAGAAAVTRRPAPLVEALLVQARPGDSLADSMALAYSRREGEYAFYQLASWTERPVHQLPRLLQRRLEARGIAGAVGLAGDPMRADWLLVLAVDAIYHDVRAAPGAARLALTAELFDRSARTRIAMRRFESAEPAARADSAAAAQAMAIAVSRAFDDLLPWLEAQWPPAAAR